MYLEGSNADVNLKRDSQSRKTCRVVRLSVSRPCKEQMIKVELCMKILQCKTICTSWHDFDRLHLT